MAQKPIKSNKAEFLSMRITPRMRFGLELLARHRRTTVGGVVALCVEKMFETKGEGLRMVPDNGLTEVNILDKVWSPYEHERFAKLAEYAFNLLSDQEKYLWGVVTDATKYWVKGEVIGKDANTGKLMYQQILNLGALESDWRTLKERAKIES